MKNFFLALLILASVSNLAHAQYEDQQQVEQGSDPAFEAWCANGTRALQRAQRVAAGQIAYGQFGLAAQTLLGALQNGVSRPNWSVRPVTWRLMVHGQRMGAAMIQAVGNNERGIKATLNALEGVYDLVLNSAQEIDRDYYRTNCGYCRGRGVREFEQRILRMSGELLGLVNGHLTYNRTGQVYPVGPARSYLVGAQVLASGAAGEIANLIYAESHACEIVELDDVVAELNSFNARPSSEQEKIAMFYDTFERIDGVVNELRGGRGCR
jgi:hypothetical protein